MESWVGLGGKEGCTNIRISAKPGIEQGTFWTEGRDLTNCANEARPMPVDEMNTNFSKTLKISSNDIWENLYIKTDNYLQ